jgi:hypothetical protein
MMGKKTSPAQCEEILRRSRAGQKQKDIARTMRLCKGTVAKIERQNGLQRNPGYCPTPEQAQAVADLVRQGHGQPHICHVLGIPAGPVRELMAKFRGRQARGQTGFQYHFSKLEVRALKRDLRAAQRKARCAVAKKWDVTLLFVEALEGTRREKHRKAHEPVPFMPKAQDLLRLLRALLPQGIPFDAHRDTAAVEGLMEGIGTFVSLPMKFSDGLRVRFGEAMAMLRREENGEWIH